jgi:mono/diheme cytochrome c family protein
MHWAITSGPGVRCGWLAPLYAALQQIANHCCHAARKMSVSCGKWSIDSHRKPIPSQIGAPDRSVHPSRHRKTEIGVIAVAAIALYIPEPDISPAIAQRQPSVARGEYIAVLGDCVACHTAGGGRTFADGLPFPTPVGTIYSTKHHAGSQIRHRRLHSERLLPADAARRQTGWRAAVSGDALHCLCENAGRGLAGLVRLCAMLTRRLRCDADNTCNVDRFNVRVDEVDYCTF